MILSGFLKMDQFSWEEYWGKETLVRGNKPPAVLKSELSILKNISKNQKAIGIVSDDKFNESINKKVKVLLKVEL